MAVARRSANFHWTRLTLAALRLSGRFSRRWTANRGRCGNASGSVDVRLKTIAIIAFALLIAGCAGHQTQEILGSVVVPTTATEIAGNHSIFIATTRKRSDDPNKVFDGERSATL